MPNDGRNADSRTKIEGREMQQFNAHGAEGNFSKLPELAPDCEATEAGGRILGAGRGSVTFLSDDWNKPMSDDEADAFWAGRW